MKEIEKQIRVTNQKLIILDYLKNVKTHPLAEEVYSEVKKTLPRITLATVYRNLREMARQGIIQEIPGKILRYDGDISSHAHFFCEKCGKVFDVFEKCSLIHGPKTKVGKVNKYQIYLYGKCKKCS